MRNLPNYITTFRLILVPIFVLLMAYDSSLTHTLAIVVFIVAAVTDYLDGVLARAYGAISDFGKMLDPLADKLLVMAALIMLVGKRDELFGEPWVPAWMVFLVLAREVWITGMRGVAASKGVVVPASQTGKVKNVMQMVAIVFLLLHYPKFPFFGLMIPYQYIGQYLLLFSILVSYWGAYSYTIQTFRLAGFLRPSIDQDTN